MGHDPQQGPARTDPAWLDQLVDLHILTFHGDLDAAAAAERWLSCDAVARDVWDRVEITCERIRTEPHAWRPG